MVSNEFFILTVAVGSVLHRTDGTSVKLTGIPENAFEIWRNGSRVFSLRKSGADLLNDLSKKELERILEKRISHDFKVEIQLLKKAIKEKST